MARPALTPDQRAAVRDAMRKAALVLLARHGEAGVTMRALADAVGCGVATTYRYFDDKQALLSTVREACFDQFAERLRGAMIDVDGPLERIRVVGREYLALAVEQPEAFAVMWTVPHGEHSPATVRAIDRSWDVVLGEVRAAVHAGLLVGDPELIANVVWVGVHGLASLAHAGKLTRGRARDDLIGPVIDAPLRAFAPSPESP